jgi:hypothetical protein
VAGLPTFNTGGASTTNQIPIYEATPDIKSSGEGAGAAAQAARRVGYLTREAGEPIAKGLEQLGHDVSSFAEQRDKLLGNQELTSAWEKHSEAISSLHDQYDKMRMGLTDPNEIEALQGTFLQKYKDAGGDFVNSMKTDFGRAHAEDMTRSHYTTFLNQLKSDNAEFAAIAVKTNVEKATTHLANMSFSNPSMGDWSMKEAETRISALYDNLPGGASPKTLAAKEELLQDAKEKIAKAAVEGVIRKGGDPAATMRKYADYLKNPDEFISKFEAEKRAERGDHFMQRSMEKDAQAEAQRKAEFDYRDQIHLKSDGTYDIPPDLLERARHDPRIGQAGFDALENHVFRLNIEGNKQANMQTYNSYAESAIQGNLTEAGILQAEASADATKRISHEQGTELRNFINGPMKMTEADKMGWDALKSKVVNDLDIKQNPTPETTLAQQKMINAALQNWAVGVRAGKDRAQLLNPDSPDYVLRGVDAKQFIKGAAGEAFDNRSIGAVLKQRQDNLTDTATKATKITDVVKALGPEQANTYLHDHGMDVDVTKPGWQAQMVNQVLTENGIAGKGTTTSLLSEVKGREGPGYDAQNNESTASGAYGFINETWNRLAHEAGYDKYVVPDAGNTPGQGIAKKAPPAVQDAVAKYAAEHYDPNSKFLWAKSAPEGGYGKVNSFYQWWSEVRTNQAQPGDVAFNPGDNKSGAYFGLVAGPPETRSGNRLMVPIISGNASDPAGVKWVDADSVLIKRAKPPIGDYFSSTPKKGKSFSERVFGPERAEPQGEIE